MIDIQSFSFFDNLYYVLVVFYKHHCCFPLSINHRNIKDVMRYQAFGNSSTEHTREYTDGWILFFIENKDWWSLLMLLIVNGAASF